MRQLSLAAALVVSSISLISGTASAGHQEYVPVTLDPNRTFAYGSLSAAAASPDHFEYIECLADTIGVLCSAANGHGYLSCHTSDPTYVWQLTAINTTSLISFTIGPSGECTSITIRNGSNYLP